MKRRGFLGSLLGFGASVPVAVLAREKNSPTPSSTNPCFGRAYENVRVRVPVKTGDRLFCMKNGQFIDAWPAKGNEPIHGVAMFDVSFRGAKPNDWLPPTQWVTIDVIK